ncbi:MAG: Crp/Fnr family transcriptional regulator [Bacteroidota bacterium]
MDHLDLKQTLYTLFPVLKEEALDVLTSICQYKTAKKHTEIISEGKSHPYSYIILKGAVKSYYLKDGKEVCIWFAFENELIGSMATFQDLPSQETLVFLEDAHLIQMPIKQLKELAQRDLSTSHLVNDLLLEHASYTEEKLRQLQFMTAHERYAALLEKEPYILQRVSLTDIASYLGVSRETLSRIRAMR